DLDAATGRVGELEQPFERGRDAVLVASGLVEPCQVAVGVLCGPADVDAALPQADGVIGLLQVVLGDVGGAFEELDPLGGGRLTVHLRAARSILEKSAERGPVLTLSEVPLLGA